MKILLIGGTGVLSTDIVLECLRSNFDVTVLNRGNHISELPSDVKFLKANIRCEKEVLSVIGHNEYDVIVDFLSTDPKDFERTYSIFANRCIQYVYISSACVFRRALEDGVINENSPKPNFDLQYSIDKYNSEQLLVRLAPSKKSQFTIVRPYITYNNNRIPYGIMPQARYHGTVIKRLQFGKPMFVWDNGSAICTLTHTKDFAYNLIQLFGNERAYNQDFNLVGDFTYTWKEVLEILCQILNVPCNIVSIQTETISKILPCYKEQLEGDRSLNAIFDNKKLKSAIKDYRQTIDLKYGIKIAVDNYVNNNFISGIDYQFDARIDKLLSLQGVKGLVFVDYLENATNRQKFMYWKYRYLSENTIAYLSRMRSLIKI